MKMAKETAKVEISVLALNRIIKALSQEPCEDAISREDVIKLVECSGYDLQFRTDNADMCDDVRKLPSVTLKPTECEDTISRAGVIAEMEELNAVSFYEANEHSKETYYEIKNMIKTISPVTPSRRKGHWIQLDYQRGKFECSECHTQGYVDTCMYEPKWKYCPICGSYNGGDEIGRSAEMVSKRCKGELYEGEFDGMESEE